MRRSSLLPIDDHQQGSPNVEQVSAGGDLTRASRGEEHLRRLLTRDGEPHLRDRFESRSNDHADQLLWQPPVRRPGHRHTAVGLPAWDVLLADVRPDQDLTTRQQ